MTGLEKMISQILAEADASSAEVKAEAEKKAADILEAARQEADKRQQQREKQLQAEMASYRERTASTADMRRRTAILAAKQEMIAKVLADAQERVLNLNEKEYFEILEGMVRKFSLPKEGTVYFSQKDLGRMPADFGDKVNKIAGEKGGTLEISKETRNIDGGFVLAYGGIEENCSIDAIFAAKKDELLDIVKKIMF